MIKAKAFRTFIRIYFLFRSERLRTNIKLTLYKALIRSIMTYACPPPLPGVCSRQPSTEIAAPEKQGSPHHWQFSKVHLFAICTLLSNFRIYCDVY
jgi:hypothetical protein